LLTRGDAAAEKKNFGGHAGLRAASAADRPPLLFRRRELDEGWDDEVLGAIESPMAVVGVVLNAVDDPLTKDGQLSFPWKLETIRPLRALLDSAARSGRVVVLASDHGHVLETGTTLRSGADGERWRTAVGDLQADEMLFEGPRVLSGGGRVILPWSERVRYGMAERMAERNPVSVCLLATVSTNGRETLG
jgi:hypothetical protein